MAFIDGDDFVSGSILSFQQANRIKNHFRLATAPTGAVGGMIRSDSDDDKLHHYGSAWEEVLQHTRSSDVIPRFAGLRLMDTNASHYLTATWNEDDSAHRLLYLLVNGADAILDIDTKEVLGVGQVLRENLIGNSQFGVWSQSDSAKGLGSLTYDTGDDGTGDIPDVGDAVTGDDSGTTGKIISMTIATGTFAGGNATGVITLGAVTGCFNDNEALSFTDGETAVVNQPDGAVGTDGIVENGAFVHNIDPPNDWTQLRGDETLTTEAGGAIGNCLMITEGGTANPGAYQTVSLTVGKIYKFSFQVKQGTEATFQAYIDWAAYPNEGFTTSTESGAGWTQYSYTFEALETSCDIVLMQICAEAAATTIYFDEVTLYEITPCCTAADTVAMDLWIKDSTADIYREHSGANVQDGSFYANKLVVTAASDYVRFPGAAYDNEEWYMQFQGRKVTWGKWVKTSTASHAKLTITDSAGSTSSSFHTGGGTYEWLEVTRTIDAGATSVAFYVYGDVAPAVDGSTIIYHCQGMLVFGSYIGEGNYKPIPQEWIYLDDFIASNALDSLTSQSDVAATTLNIEADTDAMLPKGAKAITALTNIRDSGSAATGNCFMGLRKNSTLGYTFNHDVGGKANDVYNYHVGICTLDEDGDCEYRIDASGAGTMDIAYFRYKAVQVN